MQLGLITSIALGCCAVVTGASAQVPQKFENLKVLPADIPRDSLLGIMRSFSLGLGVRCVYCHVGVDSPTLANVDFKSDEKAVKRTAREMLRMVVGINQTLAELPDRDAQSIVVRCTTCHRGIRRPVALEDTMYTLVTLRGGAAGVLAYDSLRVTWLGRAAFDFGSQSLVRTAERLFTVRRHEDALAILRRNTEAYPRFWNSYFEMGRNYEALNRRDEAIAAYRSTLERLPDHPQSVARLRALGAGG